LSPTRIRREACRKAYAVLGEQMCGRNAGKAARFFILSFSYSETSPLWNFVDGSMNAIFWGEELRSDIPGLAGCPPWWKDLPDPEKITEDDVIELFTPKSLLRLHLEGFKDEGWDDRSCLYAAYMADSSYSMLEQKEEAVDWLTNRNS
jgi:hypothetical protein